MLKKTVAAAIALAAAGLAQAQSTPSFYLAATAGATTADVDCAGVSACDKSDTGVKLVGGVKVTQDVALEVQLHNFGEVSANVPGFGPFTMENVGVGFGVAVASSINPNVDLFFRIGIASNKTRSRLAWYDASVEDSATKPYYGLGVAFKLNPQLAVRLEIDGSTFKPAGENLSATMFSAGLQVSF